jgi:hypothetical protein
VQHYERSRTAWAQDHHHSPPQRYAHADGDGDGAALEQKVGGARRIFSIAPEPDPSRTFCAHQDGRAFLVRPGDCVPQREFRLWGAAAEMTFGAKFRLGSKANLPEPRTMPQVGNSLENQWSRSPGLAYRLPVECSAGPHHAPSLHPNGTRSAEASTSAWTPAPPEVAATTHHLSRGGSTTLDWLRDPRFALNKCRSELRYSTLAGLLIDVCEQIMYIYLESYVSMGFSICHGLNQDSLRRAASLSNQHGRRK